MLFGDKREALYFSVTYSVTIGGARCVPQVCYKLGDDIRTTVEQMVEKNLAKIYPHEVRFISGSAVPVGKPERKSAAPASSSSALQGQTGKRGGKGAGRKDFE